MTLAATRRVEGERELPPRIVRSSAGVSWLPAWMFTGLLAALVLVRLTPHLGSYLPKCTFRMLTGIPCPACGGIRTLEAVARFDFQTALALNPAVCLIVAVLTVWFLWWCADKPRRVSVLNRFVYRIRGLSWGWIAAALAFLNWIYLWRTLPP